MWKAAVNHTFISPMNSKRIFNLPALSKSLLIRSSLLPYLTLAGLITVDSKAQAVPLDPYHAYAHQISISSFPDITGAQITYSTGTDKLSYSGTESFINKEMWMNLSVYDNRPCWIEAGMTKGGITPTFQSPVTNKVFQNGHFVAFKSLNKSTNSIEYHEAPYGVTTGVIGAQTYRIERKTGAGNWQIIVNGTTALTLNGLACTDGFAPYSANGGNFSDVGIEASDSAAAFTNPSYASGWIRSKDYVSYQAVTTANNDDRNKLSWSSSFSYTPSTNTNSVKFSR
jgi:hypothetical protein